MTKPVLRLLPDKRDSSSYDGRAMGNRRATDSGETVDLIAVHAQHLRVQRLSSATIAKRTSVLRNTQSAIGKPLIEATTDDLRTWLARPKLNGRGAGVEELGASSVRAYAIHLGRFFAWAVDEGHRLDDPARRIAKPKRRRYLPRPVDAAGARHAISLADPRMRVMLTLARFCGLRCCEIAAVDVEDINGDQLFVHGKGCKERVVPIHPIAAAAIAAYGPPSRGPLLLRNDGQRMNPWNVSHMGRDHLYACDVKASMHQLRHRYATDVYDECHDVLLLQELLGHASADTTRGYTQLSRQRAAKVVNRLAA